MRCEDALNQLNARADGELPVENSADLDGHLASCSECRRPPTDYQQLTQSYAALSRPVATLRRRWPIGS